MSLKHLPQECYTICNAMLLRGFLWYPPNSSLLATVPYHFPFMLPFKNPQLFLFQRTEKLLTLSDTPTPLSIDQIGYKLGLIPWSNLTLEFPFMITQKPSEITFLLTFSLLP
jgi:hypothetical protein